MTFQVHTIEQPAWIDELVAGVLPAMTPQADGFLGPLGFCWCEPGIIDNLDASWRLCLYPTPNACVGGPQDGAHYVYGFRLDLLQIMRLFQAISAVEWNTPHGYNGDLDGPEISLKGTFKDVEVWLRVFNMPPYDEPPGCHVDGHSGKITVVG